jgi:hypothetical protein
MTTWLSELLENWFNIPAERTLMVLRRLLVSGAALLFVLLATLIVAFDEVFSDFNPLANLKVGDIAPRDILAIDRSFTSDILTAEARQKARDAIQPIFDPPDPNVAGQQTGLAQQILTYIQNVRRDTYGTPVQKLHDLDHITALTLDENVATTILQMDDETWTAIQDELVNTLPRVMRESIRESELQTFRDQLPTQVSIRFNNRERAVIVAVMEDLLRANTFENPERTETARDAAAAAVQPITRQFLRGEKLIDAGRVITPTDYEALVKLGLLQTDNTNTGKTAQALLASMLVIVMLGLSIIRFEPHLIYTNSPRLLVLLALLFLLVLAALRFMGINGNLYLFPLSILALIVIVVAGAELALTASLGLAFLAGLMAENSLEIATLITAGGIVVTLTLRNVGRLNTFFIVGALVGLVNIGIIGIFALYSPVTSDSTEFILKMALALFSGALITPATAIAAMYAITLLSNLPTTLKLLDLSQPNKPLLQRLLREAPGTYQHSLQVANLAEQAASAIGADAALTHVAALYHDIGKMAEPLFFTENQQGIGNPHDILNDPYRSAAIIIGHVKYGDELAKQHRLPQRLRDFIREHHGTTSVFVFYQQALNMVDGDAAAVDMSDFTYPGPRPQSKETAILMLADSCEATVRAKRPPTRPEVSDVVNEIFEEKRKNGQLDDSGLTLHDLRTIREIFVEILQGIFHPRINYREAVVRKSIADEMPIVSRPVTDSPVPQREKTLDLPAARPEVRTTVTHESLAAVKKTLPELHEDDTPLTEVPRLPRLDEKRATITSMHKLTNGDVPPKDTPSQTTSKKSTEVSDESQKHE